MGNTVLFLNSKEFEQVRVGDLFQGFDAGDIGSGITLGMSRQSTVLEETDRRNRCGLHVHGWTDLWAIGVWQDFFGQGWAAAQTV